MLPPQVILQQVSLCLMAGKCLVVLQFFAMHFALFYKVHVCIFSCSSEQYIHFDITPIAEEWIENGAANNGVLIVATHEDRIFEKSVYFTTGEGVSSQRPLLEVECM